MIKFFRHIRQRLLSENRISKYLPCAIGKIVVVVGINRPVRDAILVAKTNDKPSRAVRYGIWAYTKHITKSHGVPMARRYGFPLFFTDMLSLAGQRKNKSRGPNG